MGEAWFTNLKVHFMFDKNHGLWAGAFSGAGKSVIMQGFESPLRWER